MKHLKPVSLLILAVIMIAGCGKREDILSKQNKDEKTDAVKQEIPVVGELVEVKLPTIQCGTCKKTIEGAVSKLYGVNKISVGVKQKTAVVDYDKSKIDVARIEEAISMAGYQANDKPADKKAYDKLEDCCKIGGHK